MDFDITVFDFIETLILKIKTIHKNTSQNKTIYKSL